MVVVGQFGSELRERRKSVFYLDHVACVCCVACSLQSVQSWLEYHAPHWNIPTHEKHLYGSKSKVRVNIPCMLTASAEPDWYVVLSGSVDEWGDYSSYCAWDVWPGRITSHQIEIPVAVSIKWVEMLYFGLFNVDHKILEMQSTFVDEVLEIVFCKWLIWWIGRGPASHDGEVAGFRY